MEQSVIEIKNLVKRYKDLLALDHLNMEVRQGEVFGLLGPNGSGKTTAINCILGLLSYDKGEIRVFGKPMEADSYESKREIGVVMQNVAVFDELTVVENIDYFCGLYVRDKKERKRLVEEAVQFVELEEFRKFYPPKLSGGLLRRLNIACGIAHKPKLIFLDEPTVAVDPQSRNKILEGILELNRQGTTVVYTSHYMEEVEQICSRILIMDKGRPLATGTKEELKQMIKMGEKITVDVSDLKEEELQAVRNMKHVFQADYTDGKLYVQCSGGSHNLVNVLGYLSEREVSFGRVYSELPTLNGRISGDHRKTAERLGGEMMFWHLYKYHFKASIRNKSAIFWSFAFPLILATLFYFGFGNLLNDSEENETSSGSNCGDEGGKRCGRI